jgi:hypothetical protein
MAEATSSGSNKVYLIDELNSCIPISEKAYNLLSYSRKAIDPNMTPE